MATQPPLRRQNDPPLLGAPDTGGGTAPIGPAALADFHEHHTFSIAQNQINLTAPPADITRDQLEPVTAQQRLRLTLRVGAPTLGGRWHGAS
jgi:hypothetical protein